MLDYTKGKIYSIRSHKTDLVYIGSTIQSLSVRIGEHRSKYNKFIKNGKIGCSSIEIFKLDPNPYIELIINFSCSCKEELRKEEGKYIRKIKCVNKNIAGRTKKEWREDNKEKLKEYNKEYIKEHIEDHKEYNKKYYEDNKEKRKEKNKDNKKKYYEKNKEKIKENKKKYYEDNKEKAKQYHKEYHNKIIKCPSCNLELKRNNLNYHKKNKCQKLNIE